MKNLKKYLKLLFSEKPKTLNLNLQKKLKAGFKIMFDGVGDYVDAEFSLPLSSLGVTNVEFKEFKLKIVMVITLERPGLLIGKAGRTIDRVKEHMTNVADKEVKIEIIESKLWW